MDFRYFVIEDKTLLPILEEYQKKVSEIDVQRKAMFREWGSNEYIGQRDNQQAGHDIVGLKDPRTFDPPKVLPKGWTIYRAHPGFVKPTPSKIGGEHQMMLQKLNFPTETKVTAEIVNRVMALDDYNMHRIGGYHQFDGVKVIRYFGDYEQKSYFFGFHISYFNHVGLWCFTVQDPGLKITEIPGCRQIKKWEFDKLIAEFNEWVDKKEN